MTDKPILFSPPMIRALLAGTKTQTRRVMSLKSVPTGYSVTPELVDYYGYGRLGACLLKPDGTPSTAVQPIPYAVGDRLWVRETFYSTHRTPVVGNHVYYRASLDSLAEEMLSVRWRPAIHMWRWASRITLTVTDVKVERVQSISEEDAKAEGLGLGPGGWCAEDIEQSSPMPCEAFALLWDSLNAMRGYGWDANPWVVAPTFTVHLGNIDRMDKAA